MLGQDPTPLFRSEVLAAQRQSALGRILINTPLAHWVVALVAAAAVASVLSVLGFAHYTPHVRADGLLVTSNNHGKPLVAQLWIPARSIGVIKPGQKVTLRYKVYPWRGAREVGNVEHIDPVPVPHPNASAGMASGSAMGYRIWVRLPSDSPVRGAASLRAGLAVQGQILLGRTRLLAVLVGRDRTASHSEQAAP